MARRLARFAGATLLAGLAAACGAGVGQAEVPCDRTDASGRADSALERADAPEAPAGEPCEGLPLDASFVVVTSPAPGARVRVPFEVVGCSRTFEGTLTWRLLSRAGEVLARGIAAGGASGGPAPFRFRVEQPLGRGLHHLEVEEPRVTDEGFEPGRSVLPLVIEPASQAP